MGICPLFVAEGVGYLVSAGQSFDWHPLDILDIHISPLIPGW